VVLDMAVMEQMDAVVMIWHYVGEQYEVVILMVRGAHSK
jgi:hypothetical protein